MAFGDIKTADTFYQKSAEQKLKLLELRYFRALSLRKLGEEAHAAVLHELLKSGRKGLDNSADRDCFAKFGTRRSEIARKVEAHYLIGLGLLRKNGREDAKAEFRRVLELDRNHLWAGTELVSLE